MMVTRVSPDTSACIDDLMKKGLRLMVTRVSRLASACIDDLMKKGLRPAKDSSTDSLRSACIDDLMKKGLRLPDFGFFPKQPRLY